MIDITAIDRHLTFIASEITDLRNRRAPWADRKADRFEAIRETLRQIRQDKQMTSLGGKRLSDS